MKIVHLNWGKQELVKVKYVPESPIFLKIIKLEAFET